MQDSLYERQRLRYADKKMVLAAVFQDGMALEYAAEELRADREVVLAAVSENGVVVKFAAKELRADRDVVLAAVSENGIALAFAAEELRADREVVLAAVYEDGDALIYAAEELCADWDFVRKAVSENGLALQYAAEELRADREVVLAAVYENGDALEFAAEELRADREVVLAAVSENGLAVNIAAKELRADREVVMAVVENGITMSSLLLLEPTPYVQQVLGWGQFFCKETSSFEELHARFCGAPVEIGDPFLEGFPDLGWRFRAEMEGMKSDDEHAADGSLVQVASQEEQDNPAKRERIDELSQEIHAPRDQAEKENRRQEDAGLTQPPRKRRR